jgi:hypothetical protein
MPSGAACRQLTRCERFKGLGDGSAHGFERLDGDDLALEVGAGDIAVEFRVRLPHAGDPEYSIVERDEEVNVHAALRQVGAFVGYIDGARVTRTESDSLLVEVRIADDFKQCSHHLPLEMC